ncbi:hypothetical protein ACOMHN_058642 [Nucella lapillus]
MLWFAWLESRYGPLDWLGYRWSLGLAGLQMVPWTGWATDGPLDWLGYRWSLGLAGLQMVPWTGGATDGPLDWLGYRPLHVY